MSGAVGSQHLSSELESLAQSDWERSDLESLSRRLGHRSIGAVLLVLALPMVIPVPAPGISVLFGLPLILVSAQLMLGRRSLWLPRRLGQRSVARADFRALVQKSLPALRSVERGLRPRLRGMTGDWAMIPVGAACLVLSLIIALPIPLGHLIPGAAISVIALGVIERDGLAVAAGLVVAMIALVVVTLASAGLIATLHTWLST